MDQLTEYFAGKPGKALIAAATVIFLSVFIYRLLLEIKISKKQLTEAQ